MEEGLFSDGFFVSETGVAVAARHYLDGGRGGGGGLAPFALAKVSKAKKRRERRRGRREMISLGGATLS